MRKDRSQMDIEINNMARHPITKEMMKQIKESAETGDIVMLRDGECPATEIRYIPWTIEAKYEHYIRLVRTTKLGVLRRCISYFDYYKAKGEEQ